jgi:acetate---CoA ligase (ADP-forming)
MPTERLAESADGLGGAMGEVGFPLALKIQSADLPHKSEVGGVELAIGTAESGREAYRVMLDRVRAARPDAAIQGVLVTPMSARGVEMIVGAIRDELFGPILMVGFGGITTELFNDVVYRPAPVSPAEAEVMLGELKSAPLLRGFRGAPPADVPALSALIARLSLIADAVPEIGEIELNPVIVHHEGHGVTIVDALVVKNRASAERRATKAHPCTH